MKLFKIAIVIIIIMIIIIIIVIFNTSIIIINIIMVMGGIQAKDIWNQGPEANIWAQEGWEWGAEDFTMRNFIVITDHLI